MAQGVYLGAGGVKDLKSCYVGAGGVKQVKQIYVGQGGSAKLVWPSYLYDNGNFSSTLGGGMTFGGDNIRYMPAVINESTYIRMVLNSDYSSATSALCGAYFNESIDMSPYSTLTMTFQVIVGSGVESNETRAARVYIGGCTEKPSVRSSSTSAPSLTINGTDYRSDPFYTIESRASSTAYYTLSLNIGSISSSLYVYIGCSSPNTLYFDVHVTNIDLAV